MKKIVLYLALFLSVVWARDELLLSSANAYKLVARANNMPALKLMQKSSAIIIFPKFVRAGFLLGGSGGKGVMMVKNGSEFTPYGVEIGGANLGLQIGYEDSSLVIYVLKSSIISDIKSSKFTIDADASASFIDKGANARTMSDITFTRDIYAYSDNSGFFAGAKFGGSIISLSSDKFSQDSYGFNELLRALESAK